MLITSSLANPDLSTKFREAMISEKRERNRLNKMLGRLATLSSSLLPPTIRRQVTPIVAEVTRLVKWGGPLVIIGNIHF